MGDGMTFSRRPGVGFSCRTAKKASLFHSLPKCDERKKTTYWAVEGKKYMKVDNNVFNLGGIDSNHRHRSEPAVLLISVQSCVFQVGSVCACRFCHIEAETAAQ